MNQNPVFNRSQAMLLAALLIIPLALGLMWSMYLDDSAYVTFHYVNSITFGRGLAAAGQPPLVAPLYALALTLPRLLGISLPPVGLVLSTLGWGIAAIAMYCTAKAMDRPFAALISALLLTFSPILISTLGSDIPWAVALAWIALALSIKKRWGLFTGALALMLLAHFDLSTLMLAALLWAVQWIERRRLALRHGLVLAIVALGWGLIATWQFGAPFSLGISSYARHSIATMLSESEFYGLFLPWIGLGLFDAARAQRAPQARNTQYALLLWAALAFLAGGQAAWAMLVTLGLCLTGLGIEWSIGWLSTRTPRLSHLQLAASVFLIAGLLLGIAQASLLAHRYSLRPIARQALERQVGAWLRAHSEPAATILATEQAGYWANRPTLPWDGSKSDQAEMARLMQKLNLNPPSYCVSLNSIAWDRLMRTDWFQDSYVFLQKFESPYESSSPYTIWRYRASELDAKERQPMNAHLPAKVKLVGYKYWPDRIQPGDTVYVTLYLQATQPLTRSLRTVMWMASPSGGVGQAQLDTIVPRGVPLDWWQAGQIIAERFALTTTSPLPAGAYQLNMSVITPDARGTLPLYLGDDDTPLERLLIGYVAAPWQGKPEAARPVNADLGHQIALAGYNAPDSLRAGKEFDVTLYWKAQQPPEDNYVVFVHVLDANKRLVAGHDGPPMEGRYPTRAWLPGNEIVPDTHHITLPPDLAAGVYRLQVGMYRWPSLERLPVWDEQGAEQADGILVLHSIQVQSP